MRKIFIDCGGFDGCSVIKFLKDNPGFDCVTFEPNEALHKYYRWIPTKLIKKAALTYYGQVELSVDDIDGDGSSVVNTKKIYHGCSSLARQPPKKLVECVDLGDFIKTNYLITDQIVLKLDIEGAEYEVLTQMIADGSVNYVDVLVAEFHWQKISLPEDRHYSLTKKLDLKLDPVEWDALDLAIHGRGYRRIIKRLIILSRIYLRRILL